MSETCSRLCCRSVLALNTWLASSFEAFIFSLFLQGNRDETFEVDEGLAEQDATSLFEVTFALLNT